MTALAELLDDARRIPSTTYASTGLEVIEQQMIVLLMERLGAQLKVQEAAWEGIDKALAKALDQPYRPVELEPIKPGNFFKGSRPSILNQSVERFPSIAVMADRARPDPEGSQMDWRNVFRDFVWVEAYVRSDARKTNDPESLLEAEGIVNSRAKRTGEAIIQTVLSEPTLGGVVQPLGEPMLTSDEPFSIKAVEQERRGETWTFQAVRVDFTVKKYSDVPEVQPAPPIVPSGLGA